MIVFLKLLLAHLLGDFVLQPEAWIEDRDQRKVRSVYLYLHVTVHFLLLIIITGDIHFWKLALIASVFHYFIDLGKVYLQSAAAPSSGKWSGRQTLFFIDQALHIATLILVWSLYTGHNIDIAFVHNTKFFPLLTAFVFITKPASVIIKTVLSGWRPGPQTDGQTTLTTVMNAGELIGYIERILTLIMMLNGRWDAIGFLVAAKSVLRIGDLRNDREKNLTEYILIGTLLSFGIAIITGIAVNALLTAVEI
ncbi:MAG TPA: DUF3307 domain-containing protein [Flavipsychrobacter sp.]|nr:DUF3307 domain-containing protein [Flavipsychrobacter sp.]